MDPAGVDVVERAAEAAEIGRPPGDDVAAVGAVRGAGDSRPQDGRRRGDFRAGAVAARQLIGQRTAAAEVRGDRAFGNVQQRRRTGVPPGREFVAAVSADREREGQLVGSRRQVRPEKSQNAGSQNAGKVTKSFVCNWNCEWNGTWFGPKQSTSDIGIRKSA